MAMARRAKGEEKDRAKAAWGKVETLYRVVVKCQDEEGRRGMLSFAIRCAWANFIPCNFAFLAKLKRWGGGGRKKIRSV